MSRPRARSAAVLLVWVAAAGVAGAAEPRPPRIVTFSPALTRLAFEIGMGDRVVGVTNHCRLPDGKERPRLGDAFTINAERILSVRPDLIVAQTHPRKFDGVRALAPNIRIETFEIETLEDVADAAERLGRLAGTPEKGRAAAARFRARLAALRALTTGRDRPRVLYVMGTDRPAVAGADTFIGDLIAAAGGVNAARDIPGETRWRQTQIDHVVAARPEVILCQYTGAGGADAATEYWLQWEDLPAARDGRVYVVDDEWTVPSLALADRAERLAVTLHPDLPPAEPTPAPSTGPVRGASDTRPAAKPLTARSREGTQPTIRLWEARVYRLVAAAVVGAALAGAGAALQGMLRNPLAEPYVLGISSGAGVGVLLGLAAASWTAVPEWLSTPTLAFLGAMATCAVVYLIAQRRGRLDPYSLILSGVIVNTFNAAIMLTIYLYVDPHRIADFAHWAMGRIPDVPGVGLLAVCGGCAAAGWGLLAAFGSGYNLLGLGEEVAASSGVRVQTLRLATFGAVGLMTGAAVALAGPVGFVGLIVPHICRMIVGPSHRRLILLSGVAGAALLVGAEVLCRRAGPLIGVSLVPVGIVTALAGGPFFIVLLRRRFGEGTG